MWLFFMLVRFVEEKKRKTKLTARAALIDKGLKYLDCNAVIYIYFVIVWL